MSYIGQGVYYKFIGSGSGRIVFDIGNGYVLKVAKNRAGIAQNKAEYKISLIDTSNLFAKVIKVSRDFRFLIMDKADKVNNFMYICNYFNVRSGNELLNLQEIKKIQLRYHLVGADLKRSSSWGIINGIPVIVDYGFTREVRQKYY